MKGVEFIVAHAWVELSARLLEKREGASGLGVAPARRRRFAGVAKQPRPVRRPADRNP